MAEEAEGPDAQARRWIVRLASGDASDDEVARLQDWRAAAPEHETAFRRERQSWRDLAALEDAFASDRVEARPVAERRWAVPKIATLAVAAAACAMLVGPQAMLRLRADHISPHGEISRVALADGSVAMLDSDSAIAVDYDGSERHVRLLEGRAWFQVRHGDARPFRVAAGDGVTEDVGTAFEVDATGDQVRVGVTDGAVRVSGRQGKTLDLRAGDRGGYSGDRAAIPISGDRDDIAGWRRGELLMRSVPLDTAIRAIARYRSAPVFLWGDFAAAAPVSGSFRTDQPEDALATLIVMRGLEQMRLPGGVLILRPKRAV